MNDRQDNTNFLTNNSKNGIMIEKRRITSSHSWWK